MEVHGVGANLGGLREEEVERLLGRMAHLRVQEREQHAQLAALQPARLAYVKLPHPLANLELLLSRVRLPGLLDAHARRIVLDARRTLPMRLARPPALGRAAFHGLHCSLHQQQPAAVPATQQSRNGRRDAATRGALSMQAATHAVLALGWPVALSTLSYPAIQLVDLCVVGHVLGALPLAACTVLLLLANLTLEPSCFVITNAVTTLCASSTVTDAQTVSYLRGAIAFSVLLALPIVGLLLASPMLLRAWLTPDVADGVQSYAPWYALSVLPSLLFAALVGMLRAQGRIRPTAMLCAVLVPVGAGIALLLVPARGLSGSALSTLITRTLGLLVLGWQHRDALGLGSPSPPGISAGDSNSFGAAAERHGPVISAAQALRALSRHYIHSLLPATLRSGVAHVLTLFALVLGGPLEAATFALSTLLLQAFHALCMGVHQATLMLTSRHLHTGRQDKARDAMLLAAALLATTAITAAILCTVGGPRLGEYFAPGETDGAAAELSAGLAAVAPYIGPVLLLKALAGLHGQFFAVTGRGHVGTLVLLISQCALGLPGAWVWASAHSSDGDAAQPAALSLMQAHAAAWLLASVAFGATYLLAPTTPTPTAAAIAPSNTEAMATPPRSATRETLARPLLEGGQPAR